MRSLVVHRAPGALCAAAAATGALSAAERSNPMSEVRGRSLEDPMPEGRRPRGVTQRPRSGAAAESARLLRRRNGGEELPKSEVRGVAERRYPANEVRGSGQEELPHALKHEAGAAGGKSYPTPPRPQARGQGRWPGGPTPCPRSSGSVGAGGPRGASPR